MNVLYQPTITLRAGIRDLGLDAEEAKGLTLQAGQAELSVSAKRSDIQLSMSVPFIRAESADVFYGLEGGLARYDTRFIEGHAHGDRVSVVPDSSVNGNDTLERFGDSRAKYDVTAGTPGLKFEGGQWYQLPPAWELMGTDSWTMIFVVKRESTVDGAIAGYGRGFGSNIGYQFFHGSNTENIRARVGDNNLRNGPSNSFQTNVREVITFTNPGEGNWRAFQGLVERLQFVRGLHSDHENNRAILGARNNTDGTGVETNAIMTLYDVILYDRELTDEEREHVVTELISEWDI